MAKLYLHVGMTKTGSTSIEATFHDARPLLIRHGIDYLDMGQNHSKIMVVAAKRSAKGLKGEVTRILGVEKGDTDYDPELVVKELESKFASPRAETVVVSGQGMLGYSPKDIRRMKEFVAPHFETVRVIVYVRDPTTWASSRAQENMKRGHSVDSLIASVREDPENSPIIPDYRTGIEAYIDTFGRENVDIRVFDRKRFVKGDLLEDFCAAIGAGPEAVTVLPRTYSNKGASAEALLLIQAHYDVLEARLREEAGVPIDIDAKGRTLEDYEASEEYRKPSSNYPFRQAVRDIEGTKFALPKVVLDEIWAKSMADIEWLRGVTGEPGLFADAYPPPEAPVPKWSKATLRDLAKVIEEGIGERMQVENRRKRMPRPARVVVRMWHRARRKFGV
jgi:hypothetical protein